MPTSHIIIKGNVQGVFYRATAKDLAVKIGITGWIKNTKEGDVEAVVSGSQEQIDQFIQWCWVGLERATVVDVISQPIPEEVFSSFSVTR